VSMAQGIRTVRLGLLLLVGLVLASCQTTALNTTGKFVKPDAGTQVLLMSPDVMLTELQAAGMQEPKAEWTNAARGYINAEIEAFLKQRDLKLVHYVEPADPADMEVHNRLINLHGAVGNALLTHTSIPALALPTKQETFDWSLGPNVARLREDSGSDLALFIHVRASYASGGRAALVMAGLLLGVPVQAGRQVGFASLVDLRTGDIVWFSKVLGTQGDLRQADSAKPVVESLLTDIPL